MKIVNINSKKLAVQLDTKILGELIEIENVVEKIGQYGNITKYRLASENDKSVIYLDLQEDYRKFALNGTITPDGTTNTYMDESGKQVIVNNPNPVNSQDGKQMMDITDSEGNQVYIPVEEFNQYKPVISSTNV
jgi:hypothetical protein